MCCQQQLAEAPQWPPVGQKQYLMRIKLGVIIEIDWITAASVVLKVMQP